MANEKRLIDAKELMENGWHLVKTGESNVFLASMSLADVPTVDAVEVVRCKDCRYCEPERHYCDHPMSTSVPIPRKSDGFCSYGERKYNG